MSATFFFKSAGPVSIANLVGHWKFDEGSGTIARDSSSTNADGTIYNGSWVSGPGLGGTALLLNGTSSYVDLGDLTTWNFDTGQMTACGWIKDGGGLNGRIFGRQLLASNNGWMWITGTSSVQYDFIARIVSVSTTANALNANWHHITTTRNGTSLKYYKDSSLVQDVTILSTHSATGGSALRIGAGSTNGSTISNYASAAVYDFRLYNRALSLSEIGSIYSGKA